MSGSQCRMMTVGITLVRRLAPSPNVPGLSRSCHSGPAEANVGSTANERTYLAYLRTSVALAMLGIVVAQLYRLQPGPSSSSVGRIMLIEALRGC